MKTNLSVLKRFLIFLILLGVGTNYAQNSKNEMYGVVKDQYGEPLLGVSILLKSNDLSKVKGGTTTDLKGEYRIVSKDGKGIVVFSFVGMKTKKVPFRKGKFNLVLEEEAQSLDEVVISTGYQNVKASEMVGAVNKVSMKNFGNRIAGGGRNMVTALEGLTPTLVAASDPSNSGNKRLLIRGVSTLSANKSPLVVVDGFPYSGGIESLNPYDIESITMLKDAASAAIYGASSGNGVIVVTTKRGKGSGLKFQYSTNVEISGKKDLEYFMNRASSKDLIEVEKEYFDKYKDQLHSYQYNLKKDPSRAKPITRNKVVWLLIENKEGRLSDAELQRQLSILENTDNLDDYEKLFLQNPLYQEHNLAVDYVKEGIKLRSSLNYNHSNSSIKGTENQGVRYALNSYIDVSDKIRLDLSGNFNISESESYNSSLEDLRLSPYERLYDDNGTPLAITKPEGKDPFAIKRFKDLGLLDETYKPAEDYGISKRNSKNWGARFQAQLRLALTNSLSATLGFNINKGSSVSRTLIGKNSWEMRTTFNKFTKKDTINGQLVKGEVLIPMGSRIQEERLDNMNYLLRAQLQYDKTFEEVHKFTALLGSEIRANKSTGIAMDKLGYNAQSNLFDNYLDYKELAEGIKGTFHTGYYPPSISFKDYFLETENRYFSLYGNASYNYDGRYVLHGSIRIDQSNLFGTDPKYRYKPLWSAGAKWRVAEEDFFNKDIVNRLDLQCSYGLNGNISNQNGPFDLAIFKRYFNAENAQGLAITSPKINDLRWEKTKSFNIGFQAGFYQDRISLTADYYIKNTTDVLADTEIDPTLGYGLVQKNDATLSNKGFEVGLTTVNVRTNNFSWSTYLNVNFNKSLVKEAYLDKDEAAYGLVGKQKNLTGYEPSSLFVFKSAGVDGEGHALIEKVDGKKLPIKSYTEGFTPYSLTHDDMIHAGTTIPKFVGRLTNNLSYKNFELSFMFIYQGGHVLLKDSYYGQNIGSRPQSLNKDIAKAWKKTGDEKKEGVLPKVGSLEYYSIVKASTKNVIKGDYLRLRDVVFSYTLPQSFISKNKYIKECRIDLKGRNLYLWTKNKEGIDPEAHGLGNRSFPITKSVSLGVNLIF